MALYIPHNILHLARLLYVRPEAFEPYYVYVYIYVVRHQRVNTTLITSNIERNVSSNA